MELIRKLNTAERQRLSAVKTQIENGIVNGDVASYKEGVFAVNQFKKRIEKLEADELSPIKESLKIKQGKYKEAYGILQTLIDTGKVNLLQYQVEQEKAELQETQKKIEMTKGNEAVNVAKAILAGDSPAKRQQEKKAISYRVQTVITSIDTRQLPREYLTPDIQKIKNDIIKHKKIIPGVKTGRRKIPILK